jgi:hypothetical protein
MNAFSVCAKRAPKIVGQRATAESTPRFQRPKDGAPIQLYFDHKFGRWPARKFARPPAQPPSAVSRFDFEPIQFCLTVPKPVESQTWAPTNARSCGRGGHRRRAGRLEIQTPDGSASGVVGGKTPWQAILGPEVGGVLGLVCCVLRVCSDSLGNES